MKITTFVEAFYALILNRCYVGPEKSSNILRVQWMVRCPQNKIADKSKINAQLPRRLYTTNIGKNGRGKNGREKKADGKSYANPLRLSTVLSQDVIDYKLELKINECMLVDFEFLILIWNFEFLYLR